MMFLVTRTSRYGYDRNEMPCDNCILVGEFCRDNRHYPLWGIELKTAKDIVRFHKQVKSEIIISPILDCIRNRIVINEPYRNSKELYEIEIYDDYRE